MLMFDFAGAELVAIDQNENFKIHINLYQKERTTILGLMNWKWSACGAFYREAIGVRDPARGKLVRCEYGCPPEETAFVAPGNLGSGERARQRLAMRRSSR